MSLTTYTKKRNFKQTSEPEGKLKGSKDTLLFVVQKHDASHLHYDFRLELEDVLVSWAVPKGPSMNPNDKRLAMKVEDHPYSYKDFEGTIPEGNYGAGNVIVWDNGTYHYAKSTDKKESEKAMRAGLKKGHLHFTLSGKKLKGEFSLVKIRGDQKNAWLLIKTQDKYASEKDILEKDRSVITKKKLEERERKTKGGSKKTVRKTANVKAEKKQPPVKAPEMPDHTQLKPMLATLSDKPFDNEDWIFEIKYDGYRTLAFINKKIELVSRNNLSFNKLFAPLLPELQKIGHRVILDGEVVVEDQHGHSDFQLLQNYQRTGEGKLEYYVFDILSLDGNDTRSLPLIERKELLKLLLKKHKMKNVFFSDYVKGKGNDFFDLAASSGLEGIIAKQKNSLYQTARRSPDWLKIKISQAEEAIIAGITEPKGSRKHIGSLILAAYKGKKLTYIGNCGTGFTDQSLKDLYEKLKPFFRDESPFAEKIKVPGKIKWVKPELVCQVKFTEWTNDGHMRHPVYMGLRIDKESEEVKQPAMKKAIKKTKPTNREKEEQSAENDRELKVGKVNLHLTNQQKIFFPEDGITKGDLVNYYNEVAPVMLPYLKGRPQSMNRFPNGIKGPSFYQKDVDAKIVPGWLETKKIYSKSNKSYVNYLICNDKATLLYMANSGCIEINPWNSKITNVNNPDWMVIDLDPEKIAFKEVVRAALEVRNIMDELETECYCKTSGATGLHVYIPLAGRYDYDIVKTFAELIAQTVFSRLPGTTSILRNPQKRQKKVYIDFLQNRKGQTLAAPYSVRPKPGATVSTPLNWNEVNDKLDPADYTIKNVFKRLDKLGDLWKPVIGKGANLDKILRKLSKEDK